MQTPDKVKQVIVVRKDLKMPVGKFGAQVSHASMAFITRGLMRPFNMADEDPWGLSNWMSSVVRKVNHDTVEERKLIVDEELAYWLDGSFTKAILSVDSEAELLELYEKGKSAGLRHTLIKDAGRTVFNGIPTHTCIAIGPNYIDKVNAVTGHLPLYR